jgi:hypothetical protein
MNLDPGDTVVGGEVGDRGPLGERHQLELQADRPFAEL